jgi:hypothetical protein
MVASVIGLSLTVGWPLLEADGFDQGVGPVDVLAW